PVSARRRGRRGCGGPALRQFQAADDRDDLPAHVALVRVQGSCPNPSSLLVLDRSSKTPKSRGLRMSPALRRPAYSSYADCAEPALAPEVAISFHQSAPAIISRICPSVRSGCAVAACALMI